MPLRHLLANRFYDIVYGKKVISEYANHFTDENEHLVTIEFSNTSLFDFNFDNLKLYDKNGQLLDLEEDKIEVKALVVDTPLRDNVVVVPDRKVVVEDEDDDPDFISINITIIILVCAVLVISISAVFIFDILQYKEQVSS